MPIPKPNNEESKKEFLDRCMIDPTMVAEYDDKQRFAICQEQLERNIKKTEVKTMENKNERHIKKILEDEKTITIVYGKSENWEGIEIDEKNEEEVLEDNLRDDCGCTSCDCGEYKDHTPEHEEEIEEDIDEEEEEEIEEDENYMARSISKIDIWDKKHTQEKRFFEVETRIDNKKGKDVVVGHAAVFNKLSEDLGGFREKILPNAFDDVLKDDVRAYFNHNPDYLLGRVSAGTLRLSVDQQGLKYELDIPNTTAGRDLKENLKNGNITQSSFAFTLGSDGDSWERNDDGMDIRLIKKVNRLYDVSPVSLPAYPDANNLALAVRSNFVDKEKERMNEEKRFELETLNLKINLLKRKK